MRQWRTLHIDGSRLFRLVRGNPVAGPPNPHAHVYESQVLGVLHRIASNAVGDILISLMGAVPGRSTRIFPLVRAFAAITNPDSGLNSAQAGIPAYDELGLARDANGRVIFGLGGGSDVRIFFSPETFSHGRAGATPDAVLAHELFHALRSMQGRQVIRPTHDRYDQQEEFWAVMIENIYLSMGGNIDLRASHHDFQEVPQTSGISPDSAASASRRGVLGLLGDRTLDSPFQSLTGSPTLSQRFTAENRTLIESLAHREPELCRRLAALSCSFNPLRDLGR